MSGHVPIPGYLVSASALIKALRANNDPPQADWPTKIQIALEAYSHPTFDMPHKSKMLRDWVIDCWTKTKVGDEYLLKEDYHILLHKTLKACASTVTAPPQVIGSFFAALVKSNHSHFLLPLAAQSFSALYASSDLLPKTDIWLDNWRHLVDYLASRPSHCQNYVNEIREMENLIASGVIRAQASSTNLKKNAQSMALVLPKYFAAVAAPQSIAGHLQLGCTMAEVLFHPSVISPSSPLQSIRDSMQEAVKNSASMSTGLLMALPGFFRRMIEVFRRHRHTIFVQASSSRNSTDVFFAAKEREAVRMGLQQALDVMGDVEAFLNSQSVSETFVWKCRLDVWRAILSWNGYMEREVEWSRLANSAARQAEVALLSTVAETQNKSAISVGDLFGIFDVLEQLDHCQTNITPDILQWVIAAPLEHRSVAANLLSSLLKYYQLTHSLERFFRLVASSVLGLFIDDLPENAVRDLYQLVVNGPLLAQAFRDMMISSLRAVASGNKQSNSWESIVRLFLYSTGDSAETVEGASRKRKRNGSASPDAILGIYSRFLVCCVEAISRASRTQLSIPGALTDVETFVNNIASNEGRSSQNIWADKVREAARLRLLRSLEALPGGDLIAAQSTHYPSNQTNLEEMAIEQLLFRLHRIALHHPNASTVSPGDTNALLDYVLDLLAAQTDRTKMDSLWGHMEVIGYVLFESFATDEQLDRLVSLLATALDLRAGQGVCLAAADIWEQARIKTAVQKLLLGKMNPRASALLSMCPPTFLDRSVRLHVTEAIYSDQTLSSALQWINRLPTENKNLTFLLRDKASLLRFIDQGSTQSSAKRRAAYIQIITDILNMSSRTPPELEKLLADRLGELCGRASASQDHRAIAFFVQVVERVVIAVTEHEAKHYTTSLFTEMGQFRSLMGERYPSHSEVNVWSQEDLRVWQCSVRISFWQGKHLKRHDGLAAQQLLQRLLSYQLWSGLQSTDDQIRLVETILRCLYAKTGDIVGPAVLILQRYPNLQIDRILRNSIDDDKKPKAIADCVALLSSSTSQPLAVTQVLCIFGGESTDPSVVRAVTHAALAKAVKDASILNIVAEVLDNKSSMFLHEDMSAALAVLHSLLVKSTETQILGGITKFLTILVRRRPDLVKGSLPGLVEILCLTFPLLKTRATTSDDRKIVAARINSRLLISISQMHLNSRSEEANPLAKHVPAILVAYVRVAADPREGLSPLVRRALEPGLFALCNLTTSGGRNNARGREGEGIGVPFSLGEGVGHEGERELWADLWQSWRKTRYAGQG